MLAAKASDHAEILLIVEAIVVVNMAQDATGEVGAELVSSCRVCLVEAKGRRCLCTDGIELAVASTVVERTVGALSVAEATEVAVTAKLSAITKASSETLLNSDGALLAVGATILLSLVAIAVAYGSSVLLLCSTIALAEASKTARFSQSNNCGHRKGLVHIEIRLFKFFFLIPFKAS